MTATIEIPLSGIGDWIGRELGPTEWERVGQDRIDLFAQASGDDHWIHTDPDRAARDAPFGGTLAHGFLTLSLIVPRLHEAVTVTGVASWLNYGLDAVRFPAPVPAGARLRFRFRPEEVRPRGSGLLLRFHAEAEIEGGTRPAMTAAFLTLAMPEAGPVAG